MIKKSIWFDLSLFLSFFLFSPNGFADNPVPFQSVSLGLSAKEKQTWDRWLKTQPGQIQQLILISGFPADPAKLQGENLARWNQWFGAQPEEIKTVIRLWISKRPPDLSPQEMERNNLREILGDLKDLTEVLRRFEVTVQFDKGPKYSLSPEMVLGTGGIIVVDGGLFTDRKILGNEFPYPLRQVNNLPEYSRSKIRAFSFQLYTTRDPDGTRQLRFFTKIPNHGEWADYDPNVIGFLSKRKDIAIMPEFLTMAPEQLVDRTKTFYEEYGPKFFLVTIGKRVDYKSFEDREAAIIKVLQQKYDALVAAMPK